MNAPLPKSQERLAKRIARAGLCSRREAESRILAGRVVVNGKKITTPAFNVNDKDVIRVDGILLSDKQKTRLWLYHKPTGLMTTHKDPQGRPTVFDALPSSMPRVISVGRLDMHSEGLLLLTNDGDLARKLELPSTGWIRRYRARVFGDVAAPVIAAMKKGVRIDGVQYGSVNVSFLPAETHAETTEQKRRSNKWLTVSLTEGKNREIRKIFDHFGCKVSRLIRLSYGPFQLGKLPRGAAKEVPEKVIASFIR